MRSTLSLLLGIGLISILGVAFLLHSKSVSAAVTHIVISQVQIAGATTDDEFVELYNPTNNPVDLSGYRLRRESQSGGSPSNLVASMSGVIPAHGYFLIAFPVSYTGSATPDAFYSATSSAIAPNNTVLLYSDAGITLIDKVGIGIAVDNETASAATPSAGGSVQRKLDDTLGHGLDTNNNSSDFEVLITSTPRNSSVKSPSPTINPSPTANPTSTPVPSPTPTLEPSPTPTTEPSITPTETPTPSPSPTPTTEPSVSPTTIPSPTVIPSPTMTPTISPTPTPGGRIIVQGPLFTCRVYYKPWKFFNKIHYFPFVICGITSR